eukprot:6175934-Pleurochrysis_carterae.AAC.1
MYAPNVDDVHLDTDRVVTELAFYNIKSGRTDVCMPLHLHLQHAGPRSLTVCLDLGQGSIPTAQVCSNAHSMKEP